LATRKTPVYLTTRLKVSNTAPGKSIIDSLNPVNWSLLTASKMKYWDWTIKVTPSWNNLTGTSQSSTLKKGIDFAPGTVTNWKITQGHLKEFLDKKYKRKDLTLKELDVQFLMDFDFYAKTIWKCGNNAALKHIQRIRKIVGLALATGLLDKNPFVGFKGKQQKSNRTFLTMQELAALEEKAFDIKRLERVKDMFVFSCYTGLA